MHNGILVSEGDVQALKDAITLVLQDETLQSTLGKNAYEYAQKNLNPEECTKKLATFFKKISS